MATFNYFFNIECWYLATFFLYLLCIKITNKTNKDMYFLFETKATKEYVNKCSEIIQKDIAKIIPTNFSLDIEIDEKEVLNSVINNYQINLTKNITKGLKYGIAGSLFDILAPILPREVFLLVSYIRLNIEYNSNYVRITEKEFIGFSGLQRNKFYDAINSAIKNKIISSTTRKSIYVVNHNMIFKGNLGEFIVKYKNKYPNGCQIDENGKIIINR